MIQNGPWLSAPASPPTAITWRSPRRTTRILVTISATPEACADCLVPKDLMRGILEQALGVPADTIDLTYPRDTIP